MPKTKTQWVCQNCGRTTAREMGKCPQCGEFNTMVEVVVAEPGKGAERRNIGAPASRPLKLSEIEGDAEARLKLPIEEFARVLGGGIVPGSVVLVAGDPGIGKSTLMLQLAVIIAETHGPVLYVSGEESARQIKMRALRLGQNDGAGGTLRAAPPLSDNLLLLNETNLDAIISHVDALNPKLLIIDSIQTTYTGDITSAAGSVSQVRECALRLTNVAKASGMAAFLIGHVTKEGAIAGPRVLEHIVDTVLYLEGDRFQSYRLLRGVKNRFGATSEVGVFEMRGSGMVEVLNPSEAFLAERMVNAPGSAIAVTMEGTRPLLVEVQALTSPTAQQWVLEQGLAIPSRTELADNAFFLQDNPEAVANRIVFEGAADGRVYGYQFGAVGTDWMTPINAALVEILTGQVTVDAALADAQTDLDAIIERAR